MILLFEIFGFYYHINILLKCDKRSNPSTDDKFLMVVILSLCLSLSGLNWQIVTKWVNYGLQIVLNQFTWLIDWFITIKVKKISLMNDTAKCWVMVVCNFDFIFYLRDAQLGKQLLEDYLWCNSDFYPQSCFTGQEKNILWGE